MWIDLYHLDLVLLAAALIVYLLSALVGIAPRR